MRGVKVLIEEPTVWTDHDGSYFFFLHWIMGQVHNHVFMPCICESFCTQLSKDRYLTDARGDEQE